MLQVCAKTAPYAAERYGYGRYGRNYGAYYSRGAYYRGGYGGYGRYGRRWRREAEPEAKSDAHGYGYGHHTACQVITDQVCRKVPVKTPRHSAVPKCDKVPSTHCVDTLRPVHDTECKDVSVPACHKVPRKVELVFLISLHSKISICN